MTKEALYSHLPLRFSSFLILSMQEAPQSLNNIPPLLLECLLGHLIRHFQFTHNELDVLGVDFDGGPFSVGGREGRREG